MSQGYISDEKKKAASSFCHERGVKSKKHLSFSSISSSLNTSPGMKDEEFLREKVFIARESAFTVVLENSKEAKAVYVMAASQLFLLMVYTIIKYAVDRETYETDVQFITSQLTGMGAFVASELVMHFSVILFIYPCTKLWMLHECKYFILYLLAILPAFIFIIYHPVYTLIRYKFLYLLTFSMTIEQVRMLMKTISFIVENYKKVSKAKKSRLLMERQQLSVLNNNSLQENVFCNSGQKNSSATWTLTETPTKNVLTSKDQSMASGKSNEELCYHIPTLNQLIYFLFAPTLIYRDCYPKSPGKRVNWYKVVSLLSEFGSLMFLGIQIVNRVTIPRLKGVGIEPLGICDMIDDYIKLNMIAVLCTFGLGYGFLHCWLNAWAEMLHFGDREFYKEWWTSENFSQFWRRWNGVVQPWIYEYLYKPMIYLTKGNRPVATFIVFLISALVHEHVTGFSLGGFLPMFFLAMFLFFPFIVAFHFLRNLNSHYSGVFVFAFNWIVWSTTMYGYGLEVFSRVNCPLSTEHSLMEMIKPRLVSCIQVKW